jgi:hypothetical protein
MKHIAYYIGSATKSVAKATLPIAGWATKQATSFATEFTRGMMEKPISITDESYRNEVRDETNNQVPTDIDNELKQELSSEPVQPELPGMNPQQPVRES